MEKISESTQMVTNRNTSHALLRGLGWGLIGGLVGTLIMDLVLMGAFMAFGLSPLTCFSIIGDTITHLFWSLGMDETGLVYLGVAAHYLVGPLVGAVFGIVVARIDALRVNSLKKSILLAILYVEILSQPLLAMTPLILKMTISEILLWYGGSFVMHFLLAVILGICVAYGLKLVKTEKHRGL